MKRLGLALGLCALGACSDDEATPTTYELAFAGGARAPLLLAARDGTGAWEPVQLISSGLVTFSVSAGFHGYVVICPQPVSTLPLHVTARFDAGPPADPIQICPTQAATVALSGDVGPDPARVFVGDGEAAVDDLGNYLVETRPGTYDVVATASSGPRMVIQRGEAVTTDRTLELDLAAGFDRIAATPVVVGGSGTVTVGAELHVSGGTHVPMDGEAGAVWLIPDAARDPGDRMVALATASDGDDERVIQEPVAGATVPELAFPAMPALAADRDGASWTSSDDFTALGLEAPGGLSLSVGVTAAWQGESGNGGALPWIDPTTLPGWSGSLSSFTAGATLSWSVTVESGDRDGALSIASRRGTLVW